MKTELILIALLGLLVIKPPAAEAGILRKVGTFVGYVFVGTVAGPVLGLADWLAREAFRKDDQP